jgi:hypothetical protein
MKTASVLTTVFLTIKGKVFPMLLHVMKAYRGIGCKVQRTLTIYGLLSVQLGQKPALL